MQEVFESIQNTEVLPTDLQTQQAILVLPAMVESSFSDMKMIKTRINSQISTYVKIAIEGPDLANKKKTASTTTSIYTDLKRGGSPPPLYESLYYNESFHIFNF